MPTLGDVLRANAGATSADAIKREQRRRFQDQNYADIAGVEPGIVAPRAPTDSEGRWAGDFSGTDIVDPSAEEAPESGVGYGQLVGESAGYGAAGDAPKGSEYASLSPENANIARQNALAKYEYRGGLSPAQKQVLPSVADMAPQLPSGPSSKGPYQNTPEYTAASPVERASAFQRAGAYDQGEALRAANPAAYSAGDYETSKEVEKIITSPEALREQEHAYWNGVPGIVAAPRHFYNTPAENVIGILDRKAAREDTELSDKATMLRNRQRAATSVAQPVAPERGVADSVKGHFYDQRDDQPRLSSDLSALREADKTVNEMPIDPVTGARKISTGGSINPNLSREAQAAMRHRAMREDPNYQNYIKAVKDANASGSWANAPGGAPALAMDQVTVSGQKVAPLQLSQAQLDEIAINRRDRKEAAKTAQENVMRKANGLRPDMPLTIREQAAMAMQNSGQRRADRAIELAHDTEKMKGEREDKRYNQEQSLLLKREAIAANEEFLKAQAEAQVNPTPEAMVKAETLKRIALAKRAIASGSELPDPSAPPKPGDGSTLGANLQALSRAQKVQGDQYDQAKAYVQELGPSMSPEDYANGVKAFGKESMGNATGFFQHRERNPTLHGMTRPFSWMFGW